MPEKKTLQRAKNALRKGKKASTAAGEFVREEFHHARSGKHGVRSKKQAIAIGLSKARRAGVKIKNPNGKKEQKSTGRASPKRKRASLRALKREHGMSRNRKAARRKSQKSS
jgi:hypothetical protein